MFIPACMSNEKLTNFYILEQNSETPHGKKNCGVQVNTYKHLESLIIQSQVTFSKIT